MTQAKRRGPVTPGVQARFATAEQLTSQGHRSTADGSIPEQRALRIAPDRYRLRWTWVTACACGDTHIHRGWPGVRRAPCGRVYRLLGQVPR